MAARLEATHELHQRVGPAVLVRCRVVGPNGLGEEDLGHLIETRDQASAGLLGEQGLDSQSTVAGREGPTVAIGVDTRLFSLQVLLAAGSPDNARGYCGDGCERPGIGGLEKVFGGRGVQGRSFTDHLGLGSREIAVAKCPLHLGYLARQLGGGQHSECVPPGLAAHVGQPTGRIAMTAGSVGSALRYLSGVERLAGSRGPLDLGKQLCHDRGVRTRDEIRGRAGQCRRQAGDRPPHQLRGADLRCGTGRTPGLDARSSPHLAASRALRGHVTTIPQGCISHNERVR